MGNYVIDCCSLLNLYIGWRGLLELGELEGTWHICEAVLNEMEYTREFGPDGVPILIPLDMSALSRLAPLILARPETEIEIEDYVNFASEVDDGEAQALAIAKHRGFVLLTDDRRAAKFAQEPAVAVSTTSTVNILQAWAQLAPANEARLYEIIPRIAVLARFSPRTDSPEYVWWKRYLRHE